MDVFNQLIEPSLKCFEKVIEEEILHEYDIIAITTIINNMEQWLARGDITFIFIKRVKRIIHAFTSELFSRTTCNLASGAN